MRWLLPTLVLVGLGGCLDQVYAPAFPLERERVDRGNHGAYFPIDAGNHANADCDACHGEFSTFTQFTCVTCHEHAQAIIDPLHAGTAGYSYGPTTCYACHPTGEGMSRAAHASYFPINGGTHGNVSCVECHPNGKSTFVCIACHVHTCDRMNSHHAEVRGYVCESNACLACHPRGRAEGN